MTKKLEELKDWVQEAINDGATSIEEIHRSIANKPFEVLERLNLSGEVVGKIQDFQNKTIGNVYDFIRSINDKIHEIATELLAKLNKDSKEDKTENKDA
ncbi:MAG: hypothetical protein HQK77_03405 [Desulfobacterales bacterium]|nr:hypothetical protein [Desulfobacterales bacterium]